MNELKIFDIISYRHLTSEIKSEWNSLSDEQTSTKSEEEKEPVVVLTPEEIEKKKIPLLKLIMEIVPYLMSHNAEAEACDALMEIEKLELLEEFVDETAFPRVCLYLTR